MSFQYHAPRTLDEAFELLVRHGPGARPLAGGTDLLVLFNRGPWRWEHLVALEGLPDLVNITNGRGIHMGAMVTHRQLELSPLITRAAPVLQEACRTIGGVQIRNRGTLGGNLCNASPAADTVPALLVLDATVTLAGPEGSRELPLGQFLLGPGQTALRAGELLVEVRFPLPAPRSGSAYLKMGRRKAMEISVASVAASVTLAEDGRQVSEVRIALGAVAPAGMRALRAEEVLRGRALSEETLRETGRLAAAECSPISDVRASAEYRRMLVEALVPRAVRRAVERAREASGSGAGS